MEAVIFMGIQGSGKTTFYRHRFFESHLRLSLDMLKTRHRQRLLVNAAIDAKQRFVLDNTNVRRDERAAVIEPAKAAKFKVVGYFFEPEVERALAWNEQRESSRVVPAKGVLGTLKRLERPSLQEGFDSLCSVRVDSEGNFTIKAWRT